LTIAMRDLEIRGAGNILGLEQSGHVEGVGFELYAKLLKKAIHELSAVAAPDSTAAKALPAAESCVVELPVSAYLPTAFIGSEPEKMHIYQRIIDAQTPDDNTRLGLELTDRFGRLPESVQNLLALNHLRTLGMRAGLTSITIREQQVVFGYVGKPGPRHLEALRAAHGDWQLTAADTRVGFDKLGRDWLEKIEASIKALDFTQDRV
jgi:transcription-repair coupling factor (superfamily II helicase)